MIVKNLAGLHKLGSAGGERQIDTAEAINIE
jgi:hypothetical protein